MPFDVSIFHNHRTTIRIRKLTLAQYYYINYRPYSDFTSLFTKVLFLFQNLLLLRHLQSVTPPQFSFFFFWHLCRLLASYLIEFPSRRFEFVWCFLTIKLKLYILGKKYREVIMYPFQDIISEGMCCWHLWFLVTLTLITCLWCDCYAGCTLLLFFPYVINKYLERQRVFLHKYSPTNFSTPNEK